MPDWEGCRWDGRSGHYESWFQRANHPRRPLAFWIRYTIFCPAGRPEAAEGELWAAWFDGERGRTVAKKTERSWRDCSFAPTGLEVRMPGARLSPGALEGTAGGLKWKLAWSGGEPTRLLYLPAFYPHGFPRAKVLCSAPNALFSGTLEVEGETHGIDSWPGSHNHNWGSRHTDVYAWAQVCGFDGAPGVFLECGTGKIALGPVLSPRLSLAVLNLDGRRLAFNTVPQMLRSQAGAGDFQLHLATSAGGVEIDVTVEASAERLVALRYRNPPGGVRACLNSKLAACTLEVKENGQTRVFTSAHRAAFEVLCDENDARVSRLGGFSA